MSDQDHLISNNTYDLLKKLVTLGLPAFASLYVGLAALWDFPNPEAVAGTCALLATFLGVVLTISTKSWDNSDAKYDGSLTATGVDQDTGHPELQLVLTKDPSELVGKKTVRLKPIDERVA